MKSCLIIDDEPLARALVKEYLLRHSEIQVLGEYGDGFAGFKAIQELKPDLIFLDIQMPQQTGIDMLKGLTKKPIAIFTTAYADFAADAFDLDAADYLRKPFSYDRFIKAVDKATDYLKIGLQKKSELVDSSKTENFLSFKSDGKFVKVFFSEIIYIEAFQEYIKIFTDRGRFITYERMKNIEAILPSDKFMRVHRSYIIPLQRVKAVSGNLIEIDTHQIPVSRDSKDELPKKVF